MSNNGQEKDGLKHPRPRKNKRTSLQAAKKIQDNNTQKKIAIYSYSLTLIIPMTSSAITSPRKMPEHAASVAKRLIVGIRALAPELARAGTAKLRRLLTVYSFKER